MFKILNPVKFFKVSLFLTTFIIGTFFIFSHAQAWYAQDTPGAIDMTTKCSLQSSSCNSTCNDTKSVSDSSGMVINTAWRGNYRYWDDAESSETWIHEGGMYYRLWGPEKVENCLCGPSACADKDYPATNIFWNRSGWGFYNNVTLDFKTTGIQKLTGIYNPVEAEVRFGVGVTYCGPGRIYNPTSSDINSFNNCVDVTGSIDVDKTTCTGSCDVAVTWNTNGNQKADIYRNDSNYWSEQSVSGSRSETLTNGSSDVQTYNYCVRGYDGQDFQTSDLQCKSVTVEPTGSPIVSCPSSPTSYPSDTWDRVWCDKAFDKKLADTPEESTEQFSNDWGGGNVAGIRANNIGFRSGRIINFPSTGTYTFNVGSDDGVRVWIDGDLVLDKWDDRGYTVDTFTKSLNAGNHQVKIDYYENGGDAAVSFAFSSSSSPPPPPPSTYLFTVTKAGTGSGTVTGSGINCGSDCTENYSSDTSVTLTASPAADSTFIGWSGDCSGTGTCTLTMNSNKSVTAMFNISAPFPDFTLNSSNAIHITLIKGSPSQTSDNTTITVTPINGFNSNVGLSVQSASPNLAGATYNFSNPTLIPSKYSSGSTFSVTLPSTTPAGIYAITIKGEGNGLVRTVDVRLNVEVFDPGWQEI